MSLQVLFSKERLAYTGVELRPHFLLTRFGVRGSAVVAWRGSCSVKTDHMVDWEDRIENDFIEAQEMLHFMGEFFGMSLKEAVVLQRLFISILAEELRAQGALRSGDDIFIHGKKLSVSIVTASPVSQLLHIGINIDSTGAPVSAIGLKDLGVHAEELTPKIMQRFQEEWNSMEWACAKVRPVM